MIKIIALMLLAYIPQSMAKSSLIHNCSEYEKIAESDFILLNKAEFIQLGQCVGIELMRTERMNHLVEACSEVVEDNISPLGVFSLSKVEAIKIGQCLGAVDYVYYEYNGTKYYDWYSDSYKTVHCTQGNVAAKSLSLQTGSLDTVQDVRTVICK